MRTLRIKDNRLIKQDAFSCVSHLVEKVTDKTLEQLEREGVFVFPELVKDTGDLSKDQTILQSVNDSLRSGNVMGFIGCGDERLVIESRFGNDGDDFFFRYLLDRMPGFPNIVDLKSNANPNSKLFSFMLFLFPYCLKNAMRKGLFKSYVSLSCNDEHIKGVIDVARHIKLNTPFTGNIAYNQREFSYDNYLTELVRHTIELIKMKPYANTLLSGVREEVKQITDATPHYRLHDRRKVIEINKKCVIRHAYYREYLALQRLCLLILQNFKHGIGAGSRRIYGILFDGAWLWEEYIASLLDGAFYHPMNKAGRGAQRLFDGGAGLIYPDFISRNDKIRIIADAKYKPVENIGNKDYLQVLAYMFRFDAKIGYYLYPEASVAGDLKLRLNKGLTYEKKVVPRDDVFVVKHGLKIPAGAETYEEFVACMKESECAFCSALLKAER
jgi:5-methylcytosine-specific restriction endonuclease McrBC regulatory subunit McrC